MADGGVAGLGGGDVGAHFAVGLAEGPRREEMEDFGVGEDGGLGVEDLWGWERVSGPELVGKK